MDPNGEICIKFQSSFFFLFFLLSFFFGEKVLLGGQPAIADASETIFLHQPSERMIINEDHLVAS